MILFMLMTIIIMITSPPSTAHHSSSRRTHRWNPSCPPEASSSWQSRLKSHNNKTIMLTITNIFDYLAGKGHNRYAIMWKIYIWVYTKMDMVKLKGYWWISFWCFVTSRCGIFAIPQNIHHREWQWCFKMCPNVRAALVHSSIFSTSPQAITHCHPGHCIKYCRITHCSCIAT